MTLALGWIRRVKNTEELVLASDSRLRSGQAWDACPKLLLTAREDAVLGFAGDTMYAYPLMIQAANHMSLHFASRSRHLDAYEAKGHLRRVFAAMLDEISDLPLPDDVLEPPDTLFLLAGFSWRRRDFAIWRVEFDKTQRGFVWKRCGGLAAVGGANRLVVLGAPAMSRRERIRIRNTGHEPGISEEEDVRLMATERIARLVISRGGLTDRGLDMEPFEVLRDMIREKASPHVGGPPQMVKLYANSNSQAIGVLWPDRASGRVAVLGRTLLDYERLNCPVMDPDTLDCGMHLWPAPAE